MHFLWYISLAKDPVLEWARYRWKTWPRNSSQHMVSKLQTTRVILCRPFLLISFPFVTETSWNHIIFGRESKIRYIHHNILNWNYLCCILKWNVTYPIINIKHLITILFRLFENVILKIGSSNPIDHGNVKDNVWY